MVANEAQLKDKLSFNSKMVRLKGNMYKMEPVFEKRFNSKMVRLKEYLHLTAVFYRVVSIPKWYD